MKDLKNIIIDLWNLFFPLLIRLFLTVLILNFIIVAKSKELIISQTSNLIKTFAETSKIFLVDLGLENFFGIYVLVVFILSCYTFNNTLIFLNSIIQISVFWRGGYLSITPHSTKRILRYLSNVSDPASLEVEIQKLLFFAKKDNIQNLHDDDCWFSKRLAKYSKYNEVLTFECLIVIILMICSWKYIVVFNSLLILILLLIAVLFVSSKMALEVRLHYQRILNKLELTLDVPKMNEEQVKEIEAKLNAGITKRWWGLRLLIIGDIRETIKNFGFLTIK
ncbi:hypothetical protein AM493_13140 [Flavobacterium akiainvivens]|uniref:Uncharacterized protein n=1 Tax=Flavobacterium akiainvivens TaxID=1202724 RepID=A0A0M8MJJ9_9FLAO|nr:hypothetical protein [Flavobacterium akiainvivens]KOS06868.1 hypothetical protein AM493_13140 [Flavobacterium akiainvivens]SFQ69313.1 hypothetical protein SAMN05444144_11521 [Flavobacterium akiainvivens]